MSAALRLSDYLDHMLGAVELATSYVHGLDKPAFLADSRTQRAVLMNLVIIGEAATKLLAGHSAFLDQHPEVPWRTLRAIRNRVTHSYFDINLDLIWEMATVDLPALKNQLPPVQAAASGLTPPVEPGSPSSDG